MDIWIITKIIAAILTLIVLYYFFKELKSVIKRDKSGEVSKKCDLD